MMSEEAFFGQVKSVLHDYAPEVPEAVYSGMRRRLWWSRFLKLDPTRFNAWYLLLGIGATAAIAAGSADAGCAVASSAGSFDGSKARAVVHTTGCLQSTQNSCTAAFSENDILSRSNPVKDSRRTEITIPEASVVAQPEGIAESDPSVVPGPVSTPVVEPEGTQMVPPATNTPAAKAPAKKPKGRALSVPVYKNHD